MIKGLARFLLTLWKFRDVQLALCADIRNIRTIPKSTEFAHHAFGAVIGGDVIMGEHCIIHPGVLIGNRVPTDVPMQPILGDNVVVYHQSTLLGNIRIGNGAKIGAHSLVLKDVPENTTAYGVPAKVNVAKHES